VDRIAIRTFTELIEKWRIMPLGASLAADVNDCADEGNAIAFAWYSAPGAGKLSQQ
jgi:hypothetical protein